MKRLAINVAVVIGEGKRDETPMLYIGEEVGSGGPELISRSTRSKAAPSSPRACNNTLALIAIDEKGSLLFASDVYMEKIAVGPGYPESVIDIDD